MNHENLNKYTRNCPQCNGVIIYKTRDALIVAQKKNILCKKCRWGEDKYFRECPDCGDRMGYVHESTYVKGIEFNLCCRSCKNKKIKITNCVICNKEIQYKMSVPNCCSDKCQKKKMELEAGVRTCSKCKALITYKTKYDKIRADENNSLCLKCSTKEAGVKKRGKTRYDIWIEKGMNPKEAKEKWEELEKRRIKSRSWYKHTPETLEKIQKNGLCNHYYVANLHCQGRWEKMFIDNLVKENKLLPTKPKPILTPLGSYFPDFEYKNEFIEIKSPWTYKMFMRDIYTYGKIYSDQKKKLEWAGANIKPVRLLVLNQNGKILKEEIYDKNGVTVIKDELSDHKYFKKTS